MSRAWTIVRTVREYFPPGSSGRKDYHLEVSPQDGMVTLSYMEGDAMKKCVSIDLEAADAVADGIKACKKEILEANA